VARVELDALTVLETAALLEAPLLLPQFPDPAWQPLPQYAVVDPHHPLLEQQLPKLDPKQVKPVVPPQVASVETFFVGVEAAAEDERVEVRTTKVELVRLVDETGLLPLHVPNPDWQPVPQ
jgi:hypothetical protein